MKAMHKYEHGSIFFVPLRDGGFARGIVARFDGRGLVFGYFFGPRLSTVPRELDQTKLFAKDAILVGQFGDIGLRNGEWPLVAKLEDWNSESWPMPLFTSHAEREDQVILTEYDEYTLDTKKVMTKLRTEVDAAMLPIDRVMGYGSVEVKLTTLLNGSQSGSVNQTFERLGDSGTRGSCS